MIKLSKKYGHTVTELRTQEVLYPNTNCLFAQCPKCPGQGRFQPRVQPSQPDRAGAATTVNPSCINTSLSVRIVLGSECCRRCECTKMVRPARGCGEQINHLFSPCPWPAGACRHRVAYCCEPDTGGGAGGGGAGGAADGCCDDEPCCACVWPEFLSVQSKLWSYA